MASAPKVDFQSMQHHQFAGYVLYVLPDDPNSNKAIKYANGNADINVQNVRDLPRPLPPWLTGVPIVVGRDEKRAYSGTACLRKLQEVSEQTIQGAGSMDSYIGAFEDGAAMTLGTMAPIHSLSTFAPEPGAGPVPPSGGAPPSLPPPRSDERSNRMGKSELEAYMRARSGPQTAF